MNGETYGVQVRMKLRVQSKASIECILCVEVKAP